MASSRSKGLLVAAKTRTFCPDLERRPSQCAMNSFFIFLIASCSPFLDLCPSMLSTCRLSKHCYDTHKIVFKASAKNKSPSRALIQDSHIRGYVQYVPCQNSSYLIYEDDCGSDFGSKSEECLDILLIFTKPLHAKTIIYAKNELLWF